MTHETDDTQPVKDYGKKAIIFSFMLPLVMMFWSASQVFSHLCLSTCSYREFLLLADIVGFISSLASVALLLVIIYWISRAWDEGVWRKKAVIAFIISVLITTFFASGAFSLLVENLAIIATGS